MHHSKYDRFQFPKQLKLSKMGMWHEFKEKHILLDWEFLIYLENVQNVVKFWMICNFIYEFKIFWNL